MSSSFTKYLDKAKSTTDQAETDTTPTADNQDKAQSFLDEKLAKNKFTIAQQDTGSKFDPSRYSQGQLKELDANGGPTVANAAEDDIPKLQGETEEFDGGGGAGDLAERYKAKFGSDAMADLGAAGGDANSANAVYDKIKSLESDDYWAKQDLTGLMQKAGHQEHIVNIGNYTKDGGLAVDASIANGINFDSIQDQITENEWEGEKGNSIGQLGSALLAAGGNGGKEEGEELPVEHSPEIKQAKERVRTYENDVLSGKTSEDVYGAGKYNLDLNKGADGIGTMGAQAGQSSKLATESFLDNKKQDVKKQYQFKAA